jgi:2-keto-4-pentenoate hydratase/2-oxohepta-3-ene-1,7-dioic acid hydratase in catechol pathway
LKVVTFVEPGRRVERVGILETVGGKEVIIDPNATNGGPRTPDTLLEVLEQGEKGLANLRSARERAVEGGRTSPSRLQEKSAWLDASTVKLKAPIPRPGRIIHTAGNFREHAKEGKESGWEFQIPKWISFLKSPSAVIGNGDDVVRPTFVKELDHEIELAIIIGKRGKHLTKKEAWDSIAGFTVFNDITARDIQREEMKSGLLNFGKNMDTFAPFGPCLVPRDDIGDVHNLKMECRVNGEPRQVSNTSHLSVSVPEIVSHYSWVTLYPGDIITTGTVSGVAAFRKNPEKYYLKPGDILESEIENIGILRNRIVQEKPWGLGASRRLMPRNKLKS